MAQHDYTIDDQNGLAFLSDLNASLSAIVSNNSGATEPSTTFAYQWWADTSAGILKRRNAANNAWINVMSLASGLIIGTDIQAYAPTASQAEMETGTESDLRAMSPLSVAQAIEALNDSHGITLGTPVASTSGTAIDFTNIPTWANRITITLNGVSLSGTAHYRIQLGVSGLPVTTGYIGSESRIAATSYGCLVGGSAGFDVYGTNASRSVNLVFTLSRQTGYTYLATWTAMPSTADIVQVGAGIKTLTGNPDMIRVTTTNGTDTFDAGTINISYE